MKATEGYSHSGLIVNGDARYGTSCPPGGADHVWTQTYSLILGVVVGVVSTMQNTAPSAVLWALLSVQSAVGALVVWRRTDFRFFAATLAFAAAGSAIFAGLASRGLRPPFVPLAWNACLVSLALASIACLYAESKRRPVEWSQWRQSMKQRSAIDILLARHIPSLRDRGSP